jgi:hypothetical protein
MHKPLLLLLLCAAPALWANPVTCVDATLADYIALGSSGCYLPGWLGVDAMLVHDFVYTASSGSAADVAILAPPRSPSQGGYLVFSSPDWTAADGGIFDVTLGWSWDGNPLRTDYLDWRELIVDRSSSGVGIALSPSIFCCYWEQDFISASQTATMLGAHLTSTPGSGGRLW